MKWFYLANGLITLLVGGLFVLYGDFSFAATIVNKLLLMCALEIPSLYFAFVRLSRFSKKDNELLAPGAVVVGVMFLVDVVVYAVCLAVKVSNLKGVLLYTIIFHGVVMALLLVIRALTDYIRKQHEEKRL